MTKTNFRALCAELIKIVEEHCNPDEYALPDVVNVLNRACAALAQTEPAVPSEEEIVKWHDQCADLTRLGEVDHYWAFDVPSGEVVGVVRAALARWGTPAINPVPVSDRLPGPEDCAPWPDEPDATPWCWAAKCVDDGWEWTQLSMLGLRSDTLGRIIAGGGWTHWLPHWALPVPTP